MIRSAHGRQQAGFTLVEILAALAIFVVGMSSIVGLLVVATGAHRRALVETDLCLLTESILAQIEGSSEFVLGQKLQDRDKVSSRHYPGFSYTIRFEQLDGLGLEVLVRVQVFWRERGEEQSRTYRTILLRRTPS